jgi:hypothetical protein
MPLPTCPPKFVTRHASDPVRKGKKIHLKSTCIPDVGKPGKTPKKERIPSPSADMHLSEYGYKTTDSVEKREAALKKAVSKMPKEKNITKREAIVKILRHLNLLATLQRYTNPALSKLLKADSEKMSAMLKDN